MRRPRGACPDEAQLPPTMTWRASLSVGLLRLCAATYSPVPEWPSGLQQHNRPKLTCCQLGGRWIIRNLAMEKVANSVLFPCLNTPLLDVK